MQQAVCVRRGKQKKIGKKNTKKNAAPKTHHEIHSNPATATNSRRRASCYFCAILGSPPASLGQVTRWESKGVRSFVCWSANELTLDSFFCSYWATEQFVLAGLARMSVWVENSMPKHGSHFPFLRADQRREKN